MVMEEEKQKLFARGALAVSCVNNGLMKKNSKSSKTNKGAYKYASTTTRGESTVANISEISRRTSDFQRSC